MNGLQGLICRLSKGGGRTKKATEIARPLLFYGYGFSESETEV